MLKSTYKPSANILAAKPPPLPPGWTEHKAPTGHTYYYNSETKESTYKRPGAPDTPAGGPPANLVSAPQYPQAFPNLSDPAVANAFLAAQNIRNRPPPSDRSNRDQRDGRPKPQPLDKPLSKVPIPGCDPWILVYTKYGRRFVYNSAKNASYWRIPDKLKPAILELDQARVREKMAKSEAADQKGDTVGSLMGPAERPRSKKDAADTHNDDDDDDSSEYEEVEVTDDEESDTGSADEAGDDADHEHRAKRQRTQEEGDKQTLDPEAEMLLQLQMMGNEYGLEQGEYDDGNSQDWPEGAEGVAVSEEDARELFKDMLNDFRISPYSPWDKLIEEGKVFDDPRYTVLNTTKARKDVWEEWCKEKIKELKELRAKEEKKDPKVTYMTFLEKNATPKLYWPEFKRKFRKEACMKEFGVSDRDREKWYREYINRLKLPQSTLKSDLTTLLKSLPLSVLNNATDPSNLPAQLRADPRYISLQPGTRDPLVEAYIQTLGPPPESGSAEDDTTAAKVKGARRKRELALEERNKAIAEQKQRDQRNLEMAKARLRQGELEIERAMHVGKKGLQSQLQDGRPQQ